MFRQTYIQFNLIKDVGHVEFDFTANFTKYIFNQELNLNPSKLQFELFA